MKTATIESGMRPGIVALDAWAERVGRDLSTVWQWRKNGWLQTINICGRQYVTAKAEAEFNRRAEAGEFSKECVPPTRKKKAR